MMLWTVRARPIVAKFHYYGDKMEVKQRIRDKRNDVTDGQGTSVRVSDQYPKVIQERRRKLIPYLVQARNARKQAVLSFDTLYIDNRRYTADNPPPGPVPELPPRPYRGGATGHRNGYRHAAATAGPARLDVTQAAEIEHRATEPDPTADRNRTPEVTPENMDAHSQPE